MDIYSRLKEPFKVNEVHWRVGSTNAKQLGVKPWEATKGIPLAYIDARDAMKRLDDVVGFENWSDEYSETSSGRVICKLSVRINGEWITKSDGAGDTGTEGEKGAISDAFKRAAVKFGVGRYLYYLPTQWVDLEKGKIKNEMKLPSWAVPGGRGATNKEFMDCLRDNFFSIAAMKAALLEDNLDLAAEAWHELDDQSKNILKRGSTLGGILTPEESLKIKNDTEKRFVTRIEAE